MLFWRPRTSLALSDRGPDRKYAQAILLLGVLLLSACIKDDAPANSDLKRFVLTSKWVEAHVEIEESYVGTRFDEAAKGDSLGQVNFSIDLDSGLPAKATPDENANVVVIQMEAGSPDWITKQLDPSFLNYFSRYPPASERRYGLWLRPSIQPAIFKSFLLEDLNRAQPIMIECQIRPNKLPMRCHLQERRGPGFIVGIFFNGSRLEDWPNILERVDRFISTRVKKISSKKGVSDV